MKKLAVGTVCTWDRQSDVFGGQYQIVEQLGGRRYRAVNLAPSDELIAEIEQFYLRSEDPYLGYHDPFGPERRRQTRQEAFDEEVSKRIEDAGRSFEIEIVSADRWAAMF